MSTAETFLSPTEQDFLSRMTPVKRSWLARMLLAPPPCTPVVGGMPYKWGETTVTCPQNGIFHARSSKDTLPKATTQSLSKSAVKTINGQTVRVIVHLSVYKDLLQKPEERAIFKKTLEKTLAQALRRMHTMHFINGERQHTAEDCCLHPLLTNLTTWPQVFKINSYTCSFEETPLPMTVQSR